MDSLTCRFSLLLLFSFFCQIPGGESRIDMRVTAYDCSAPVAVEPYAYNDATENCDAHHHASHVARNETYQLLVHETTQRLRGHRCRVIDTKRTRYCGNADHQTLYTEGDHFNVPKSPTVSECQRLVDSGEYVLPDGSLVRVSRGTITTASYASLGNTELENDAIWGKQVSCEGETGKFQGKTIYNMITDHNLQIMVEPETFVYDSLKKTLQASDGTRLPCGTYAGSCHTATATYLWKPIHGYCPLAQSKLVTGLVAEDISRKRVFMSTDNSLVRLVLGAEESHCDRSVTSTNYPNLFLARLPHRLPFQRPVDPTAISMSTYVNNRDDFLYHKTIEQLDEELSSVLAQDCVERKKHDRRDFFLKLVTPGLATYMLGNGTFATSSGEAMYYHRCPPVEVTAMELDACFSALPVKIPEGHSLGQRHNSTQWFLEPLTHRLTRFAARVPCTRSFPALYKLSSDRWISAGPELRATEKPRALDLPAEINRRLSSEVDPSVGGVYSAEELAELEAFLSMPAAVDALGVDLGAYAKPDQYGRVNVGRALLAADPLDSMYTSLTAYLLRILRVWGEGAAIFTSLYLIGRFLFSIGTCLYGGHLLHGRRRAGLINNCLWGLCPALFLIKQQPRQRQQPDEDAEQQLLPLAGQPAAQPAGPNIAAAGGAAVVAPPAQGQQDPLHRVQQPLYPGAAAAAAAVANAAGAAGHLPRA